MNDSRRVSQEIINQLMALPDGASTREILAVLDDQTAVAIMSDPADMHGALVMGYVLNQRGHFSAATVQAAKSKLAALDNELEIPEIDGVDSTPSPIPPEDLDDLARFVSLFVPMAALDN